MKFLSFLSIFLASTQMMFATAAVDSNLETAQNFEIDAHSCHRHHHHHHSSHSFHSHAKPFGTVTATGTGVLPTTIPIGANNNVFFELATTVPINVVTDPNGGIIPSAQPTDYGVLEVHVSGYYVITYGIAGSSATEYEVAIGNPPGNLSTIPGTFISTAATNSLQTVSTIARIEVDKNHPELSQLVLKTTLLSSGSIANNTGVITYFNVEYFSPL